MKNLNLIIFTFLLSLLSTGLNAQPFNDIVCLEITVGDSTSVIGLTANALEDTQNALAAEGISSTVVDCNDIPGFELPNLDSLLAIHPIVDPFDFGSSDFGDLVCLEVTANGTTSIITVSANIVEDTQNTLTAQGFSSEVVECENLPNFDLGWTLDLPSHPFDNGGFDFGEIVCLEITVGDSTSIIGITANALEDTQNALAAEGISSTVVECDDFPDIDLPTLDSMLIVDPIFDPFDFGSVDFGDLVCLEVTANGVTSIITVSANVVEDTQNTLADEGFSSVIVECENLPDFGTGGWTLDSLYNPFENGDFDFGDLVCLEITVGDSTSIIGITANILEETQDALAAEGISSTVVECEPFGNLIDENTNQFVPMEESVTNVGIYPNPANYMDVINVNFDSQVEENVSLVVFNQFGQKVSDAQLNTNVGRNSVELNSRNLDAGLYIVSISNGKDLNITEKLMVVK